MKTIKYQQLNTNSLFASLNVRVNTDEAFENAIQLGMKDPEDWMYMYSQGGCDYFKHYDTREYCRYPQRGLRVMLTKAHYKIKTMCGGKMTFNEMVSGNNEIQVAVMKMEAKKAKNGKIYTLFTLGDGVTAIEARMWENPGTLSFKAGVVLDAA